MNAYIDSSVLLRVILDDPGQLPQWTEITRAVSSTLLAVECGRAIDRARVVYDLTDEQVAAQREAVHVHLDGFELAPMDDAVVSAAAGSFPILVRSLDAIHLATAVALARQISGLVLATHDERLAMAGRALGLRVVGTHEGTSPS